MSVVSLIDRATKDRESFLRNRHSADSKILIESDNKPCEYTLDENGLDCLTLHVGEVWWEKGIRYSIPEKGIKLKAHTAIVLETKECVSLPYNVYGIILGTGRNIYTGGFVSSGKIDPSFSGNLRIGFYNGSNKKITIYTGDKIAQAIFYNAENCLYHESFSMISPAAIRFSAVEKIKRWIFDNIAAILSSIAAIFSIIATILSIFL